MAGSGDWWRRAVVYQVYIRSFADGDGDGVGDIAGIRSRLPYLRELGVDALWITPWYPSPMADGGYDVADYTGVDPMFGSVGEAVALFREAHDLGLRVLLDLVPNHTSSAHPWFAEALAAPPGSAARSRFVFREGLGTDRAAAPTDWVGVFGGPAWERVTGADGQPEQWYLHQFAIEQPDLDWDNHDVRAMFEAVLRTWFERGVDGFRIDVANSLVKDLSTMGRGRDDERAPRRLVGRRDEPALGPGRAFTTSTARGGASRTPRSLHASCWARCTRRPWRASRATCDPTSCTARSTSHSCGPAGTRAACEP